MKHMRIPLRITLITGLVLVALVAPAAKADYAVLRSGTKLHITGYEKMDGDTTRLYVGGGTVDVASGEIVRFEPEDEFLDSAVQPKASGPYAEIIQKAADKNGVDEELVSSIIAAESNFNASAVSRKNAQGLMQLIPSTARQYSAANPFDPSQNVEAGTHYLKDLLTLYDGDTTKAVAAYNAGPKRVDQYQGVPPYAETQAYVKRVEKKYTATKKERSKSRQHRCIPELVVCTEDPASSSASPVTGN
jgi:hypothetical protein